MGAQMGDAVGRRGQRQQAHALLQTPGHAHAHVAAANDQHALAAKSRGQRA
jgi:hypothetical protein